jgi:hypothetical protein
MKNQLVSLSFAILSLLAVACHKSDSVNPPTAVQIDSFAGVYTCQVTQSYGINGAMATERPQSATLIVSRITNPDHPKQLLFKEQYLGFSRRYSVYFDLDSTAFSVDKFEEQISVNGVFATGVASGLGKFSADGKTVSLITSTDVIVGRPYNRTIKLEGIKN